MALGTGIDPTLSEIVGQPPFSTFIDMDAVLVVPVKRATREYPRARELLDKFSPPSGFTRVGPLPLTADESAECIFVRDTGAAETLSELRGRDVLMVHAIGKQTNLPVIGHAVFGAEVVRRHEPSSLRSIVLTQRRDQIVERHANAYGVEVVCL